MGMIPCSFQVACDVHAVYVERVHTERMVEKHLVRPIPTVEKQKSGVHGIAPVLPVWSTFQSVSVVLGF